MKPISPINLLLAFVAIFAGITLSRSQTTTTAPTITTQPIAAIAPAGSSVTFTVVADGTPPLSYQWLKGGAAIVDPSWQKPSLALEGVSSNDETDYSVRVTNAAGSVTSAKAKLTISTGPVVVVPPTPPLQPAATVSIRFNKDGSTYFRPSPTSTLTVECGNGLVVIDVATGTVTLPDPVVQPLDATATAWWLAVVNAFPEAKKQIKANP